MRSSTYLHDLLVSTIFTEELDDPDLWMLGFSAMWVKGADLDVLAAAYGWDLGTRTACYLSDILDHNINDGSTWVAEVNGWIMSRLLPRGRLHVFSGGHVDPVIRADDVAPEISEFLLA